LDIRTVRKGGEIERKFRKRRELGDAQGLRPNVDDLLEQEFKEVGQVLTGSQLRNYRISRGNP
jgi:hypothetical protein